VEASFSTLGRDALKPSTPSSGENEAVDSGSQSGAKRAAWIIHIRHEKDELTCN
jgi:hypothetical protein